MTGRPSRGRSGSRPSRHGPYERKDVHYRRARAAGYRARSAYKLVELDDRFRVLRPGDIVADLGAWPGAWLQVAAERIRSEQAGRTGRVVGLDLVPVAPLAAPHATSIIGDVRDPVAIAELRRRLGAPADVVLCDLAPKLTGIRDTDEARSAELLGAALDGLGQLLRPGGHLVLKLFMGSDLPEALTAIRIRFEQVRTTRPEVTRRGSSEMYVVALGYRGSCG